LWADAAILQERYDPDVFGLSDEQRGSLRAAVVGASARPEVRGAVHNVYRALQDAIELRKPICSTSGRCCRFDQFGHKLFVTTMELGTLVHDCAHSRLVRVDSNHHSCPFQQQNLCSLHAIRPFGCRVFFCDETSTDWQREQYGRFHAEFKRLHEEFRVPYYYIEWREALSAVQLISPTTAGRVVGPNPTF
jgi:hypothetical protein